ncbi:MAG: hypothetical protein ACYDGR_09565 [Candidatus Dormibacteria bacterium]
MSVKFRIAWRLPALLVTAMLVGLAAPQTVMASGSASVTVDANTVLGTTSLRAQGFLHAVNSSTDHATVAALAPKLWRINNDSRYDLAKSYGAKIMWVVSDSCNYLLGLVLYQNCVTTLASSHSPTSARPVDYWDVWGEPDHVGLPGPVLLPYFKAAHDGIRSVDPNAKVGGPDLAVYSDAGGTCQNIDMTCFLDYVVANNLQFDVLSWNEILDAAGQQSLPTAIGGHASAVRALVAARPGLRNPSPQYMVEEYSDSRNFTIPGWTVAWLKFLEESNLDAAGRACWDTSDTQGGQTYSGCVRGMDGLLQSDEITPRAIYWVHKAYAGISTSRVLASSTSTDTVAYAGRNDASRELTALVGRWSVGTVNSPTTVTATFNVPASYGLTSVHYTVNRIPNQFGAVSQTPYASGTAAVLGGQAQLTVNSFADGDAYTFDLTP